MQEEAMKPVSKRILYWAPRVFGILFAIFLSLFALDVFGEGYSVWETILALLIHLVPVYIVFAVLLLAWRWSWVGAIVFLVLAILYVIMSGGRQHWSAYVGISGPLLVISVLWLLNWIYRSELSKL
jgi:hypothetical protein